MAKQAECIPTSNDAADLLLKQVGGITNHQTDLPRIAKDAKLVAAIEAKLERLPTAHNLYRADARTVQWPNVLPKEYQTNINS